MHQWDILLRWRGDGDDGDDGDGDDDDEGGGGDDGEVFKSRAVVVAAVAAGARLYDEYADVCDEATVGRCRPTATSPSSSRRPSSSATRLGPAAGPTRLPYESRVLLAAEREGRRAGGRTDGRERKRERERNGGGGGVGWGEFTWACWGRAHAWMRARCVPACGCVHRFSSSSTSSTWCSC